MGRQRSEMRHSGLKPRSGHDLRHQGVVTRVAGPRAAAHIIRRSSSNAASHVVPIELELTCRSFCAGREKGIATRRDGIGVSRAFRCVARRDDVDPGAPDQGAVRRQHGAPQDSGTQNIVLCLSKFGRLLSRIAVFGALALTTVYLPDPMSLTLGSAPGHSVLRWGAPIMATKRREGKVSRVILRGPSALVLVRQRRAPDR
jgi:hypothetical protein